MKSDLNGCHTVQDFARGARLQLRFSYVGEPEGVGRRVGKIFERRLIVIASLEIKIGQVFVKLEQFTSGSSPSLKIRGSAKRCHNACIYYRNPYSSPKAWKYMKNSWVFAEISSQASPETLSVTRECCWGHFSWKIFSSIFQLLFWIMFFSQFHQKFNVFLKQTW